MRTKEENAAYHRAYRAANPDRTRGNSQRYRERHPEIGAAYRAKLGPAYNAYMSGLKRARRAGAPAIGVPPEVWTETMEWFDGRCAYCLEPAGARDHVEPLSKGGADSPDNVVPCCKSCNSSKKNKTLIGWLGGLSV